MATGSSCASLPFLPPSLETNRAIGELNGWTLRFTSGSMKSRSTSEISSPRGYRRTNTQPFFTAYNAMRIMKQEKDTRQAAAKNCLVPFQGNNAAALISRIQSK